MRVGLLTIGQSPRVDVLKDLSKLMPEYIEIIEAGALDDYDEEYIKDRLSPAPEDVVYVSRLRTGTEVKISKSKIIPLMQKKVDYLNSVRVDLIAILCTGEFPEFTSKVPVIYPEKVLKGLASSLGLRGKVGVLIPDQSQVGYAESKWREFFDDVIVHPASPYKSTQEDFVKVAERLRLEGVTLVVMDCIGYTVEHKNLVRDIVKKPVIASRTILARTLAELLG
ncbi:MAG: AroM family protein [Zestosphaera sp.]